MTLIIEDSVKKKEPVYFSSLELGVVFRITNNSVLYYTVCDIYSGSLNSIITDPHKKVAIELATGVIREVAASVQVIPLKGFLRIEE